MRRVYLLIALLLLVGCSSPGTTEPTVSSPQPANATPQPANATPQPANATPQPTAATPPLAAETTEPVAGAQGTIAFVYGGNIWGKDLANGTPRPYTTAGGFSSPSWSPSLRWLLAHRDDGWYLVSTARGTEPTALKPLPPSGLQQVAWSPVADLLAVGNDRTIQTRDLGTLADSPLVSAEPGASLGRFSWSPDGKWIAYEMRSSAANQPPSSGSLWRVPSAGGTPEPLYQPKQVGMCMGLAGWTPDSKGVLFWPMPACSASILADGAPLMLLPIGEETPVTVSPAMLSHPDFWQISSQGELAVAAGGSRTSWAMKGIMVSSGPLREGHTVALTPKEVNAISPAWSPDGKLLAYVGAPATSGSIMGGEEARQALKGRRLWLSAPNGSGSRALTNDPLYRDESPVWTGDGTHILFARLTEANEASLWVIDVREKEPKLVKVATIDPVESGPSGWFGFYGWLGWSTRFAYTARPGN
ncbi:MAG: hypothetical protein ACM3XM_15275 [Mycobacterium leprae]